jgi:hypothetical protein
MTTNMHHYPMAREGELNAPYTSIMSSRQVIDVHDPHDCRSHSCLSHSLSGHYLTKSASHMVLLVSYCMRSKLNTNQCRS